MMMQKVERHIRVSLEAVVIFSAAFALSGMVINFVLSAMG